MLHVTMTLKYPEIILGKVAKFRGHSLNGLEVTQHFSEGGRGVGGRGGGGREEGGSQSLLRSEYG